MDSQARGLIKGLENWAKKVTTGYKDVSVQNMSSSFRDGLAFCAVIHHYRPDLIDFESLSKENILQNNSLAFSTAEKQLGVPALLDAEDMVKYSHPDRLSIITYLSQLHNCFENQNKVKVLKTNFKRVQNNSTGPPSKVSAIEPKLLNVKRHELCFVCGHRVFILERLIVDGKLYHTACFRCSKCKCLLNPGAYVESDTPGLYECAVCLNEENSFDAQTREESSDSSDERNGLEDTPVQPVSPARMHKTPSKPPFSESVSHARSNFLQDSLSAKSTETKKVTSPFLKRPHPISTEPTKPSMKEESSNNGISVKDKISVFEPNRSSKLETTFKIPEITSVKSKLPNETIGSSSDNISSSASLRTSAKLSSNGANKQNETVFSPEPLEKLSNNLASSSVEEADSPDSNAVPKSSLNTSLQKSETTKLPDDKANCDNLAASSVANKVPSPSVRRSLLFQPETKGDNNVKTNSNRQFQYSEYKSPLKASRDIFQTNLQPLKLSIPSISSSSRKDSTSLPVTPLITSSDPSKAPVEIPQIRSTYARTLPRPNSGSDLAPKAEPTENGSSDTNLTNILHSKWSRTVPRRSSFDSYSKKNGTEAAVESPKPDGLIEVCEPKLPNLDAGSSTPRSRSAVGPPVPSVRRSLELKRNLNYAVEPPAEVDSAKDLSQSNSKLRITQLSIASAKLLRETTVEMSRVDTSVSAKAESEQAVKTKSQKETEAEPLYPDDLNPFGDEEEEEEYPDDLNPFGDDEEGTTDIKVSVDDYDETKNPFASDDDTDATPVKPKLHSPRSAPMPNNSPFSFPAISSPTGSLRGTTKKRLAPKPPPISEIFPNSDADVSMSSVRSSPSGSLRSLQTPSPKIRKNKPAPPPPPAGRQTSQVDLAASAKQAKNTDNMKLKSTSASAEVLNQAKKKKRPAPPVPIPKRKDNKKIPLKEILREMKEIEEKQRECERQGREIELLIRDRDKDEEPSVEEEENIMQLFDLVNQKNALFRRQAELMYIKRSQRLEEQQAEIEMQIRQLLEKPEAEKSDDDRAKEEELILEFKDIVDQRSSIIDSIEMDRRRELEEDASVQEQLEIKNAEIKEKGAVKAKKQKGKKKKEKKKKQENEGRDGEKPSKRKWLSK